MSFAYHLNKISLELQLSLNQNIEFDKDFRLVRECNRQASKKEVLERILSILEQAHVYYLSHENANSFLKVFDLYVGNKCRKEINEISEVTEKIHKVVINQKKSTITLFQGSAAREINTILDKAAENINNQEFNLLLGLASNFCIRRLQTNILYYKSVQMEKAAKLKALHPKLVISPDGMYGFHIQAPKNPDDLQFFLFLQFHHYHHPGLHNADNEFLKKVIRKILQSPPSEFQDFLKGNLAIKQFMELFRHWDSFILTFNKQVIPLISLYQKTQKNNPKVTFFVKELIQFPECFFELMGSEEKVDLLNDKYRFFMGAARETACFLQDKNSQIDLWYKAIYEKIKALSIKYAQENLPLLEPNHFNKLEKLITPQDTLLPIEKDIKQWKKEIRQELVEEKNSSSDKKVEEIVIVEKITAPSQNENLEEDLLKTSPFEVQKRITRWFCEDINQLPIENEETLFVHNFAWAANKVLWEFGLRYSRENGKGHHEPALVMLCEVEYPLFKKKELFKMTITFDYQLSETKSSKLKYDSNWNCYHRTLTRRKQQEEMVEEYFANGAYQFIDFPPLLSQRINIDNSKLPIGFVYPDGSYIESVEGSVITLRDPKNDEGNIECRLRLFVVR